MNATIAQSDLDRCTRLASSSVDAALAVVAMLAESQATGEAPEPEALRDAADDANDAAQMTFRALCEAGGHAPDLPERRPVPLHLLDTPATRRLLDLLRQAQDAAEAVDAERGNVLPDHIPLQPGESRGTGYAEMLSEIGLRLSIEVEGPRDLRQGRE